MDENEKRALFPDVPEDLSALSDDELATRAGELRGRIAEVKEKRNDKDVVGELTTVEVVEAWREGFDAEATRAERLLEETT